MPFVLVEYNKKKVPKTILKDLRRCLPMVVANAFNCTDPGEPDGTLTRNDIDVRFRKFKRLDVKHHHLAITIVANDFPSRLKTLKERNDEVGEQVRTIMGSKYRAAVWTGLMPAAWWEFDPQKVGNVAHTLLPMPLPLEEWANLVDKPLKEITELTPYAVNRLSAINVLTAVDLVNAKEEDIREVQGLRDAKGKTIQLILKVKADLTAKVQEGL